MKKLIRLSLLIISMVCGAVSTYGQEGQTVSNIEVNDLHQKLVKLPHFGDKNLMIFYVDPDRAGQNDEFIRELREDKNLRSDKVVGMSVMNVLDAPMIPNGLAYRMAQKRAEAMHTPFFIDEKGELATQWKLGDCDNFSTIILVDIEGTILFVSKGKISPDDKTRFYEVYNSIK